MAPSYSGNRSEDILFKVLKDIEPYIDHVVLVGGWLPYIYHKYLWKQKESVNIVATQDIDLALKEDRFFKGKYISDMLGADAYYFKEKIYDLEEYPFCFVAKDGGEIMKIDFISHEYMDPKTMSKLTGKGLEVAPIGYVEYMTKAENTIVVEIERENYKIRTRVPLPAVYVFVKGLCCDDREIKQRGYKFKKDLWSIYFVIENMPSDKKTDFINVIKSFNNNKDKEYFEGFCSNLKKYFKNSKAEGPKAVSELLKNTDTFLINRVSKAVTNVLNELMR